MGGFLKKFLCMLLFAFGITFAALEKTVAVLPTDGEALSKQQTDILTSKMREAALKALPENKFSVLKQETVYNRLGGMENYIKECSETNCIVNLGKKAKVDYVAQCRVVKESSKYWITVELYEVSSERQLPGPGTKDAMNFDGLVSFIDKEVPAMFKKMSGVSSEAKAPVAVQGGISGLESADDYEFDGKKR
jgi:TolB-like protein